MNFIDTCENILVNLGIKELVREYEKDRLHGFIVKDFALIACILPLAQILNSTYQWYNVDINFMTTLHIIIVFVFVLLLVIAIFINNVFIAKRNKYREAKAAIEIYLKKRFDLVPNLIATVRGYVQHEQEVLKNITTLRSQSSNQNSLAAKDQLSTQVAGMWAGLNITAEAYPDLKANDQFLNLQKELSNLEDYISAARRSYNAAVTSYNNYAEMFPMSIIALMRGFKKGELLDMAMVNSEMNIGEIIK